jgi:plastocyanin domain-containing protein
MTRWRNRWTLLFLLAAASCAPRAARGPAGEVAITVTDEGFVPAQSTVPKGVPITLIFTRKSNETCVTDVVFGRLGKSYPLPLNQPVRVEIPGGVQDTLGFICPMDMYRGTIQAN